MMGGSSNQHFTFPFVTPKAQIFYDKVEQICAIVNEKEQL